MQNTPLACPLCQYNKIEFYFEDIRSYWQCDNCQLVFVAPSEHLNVAKSYDFVTSTEVLEHLREPREELQRLTRMLRPNGYLGIMTKLLPPFEKFADWHYKRDLTHICFYSESTFEWVAAYWDL